VGVTGSPTGPLVQLCCGIPIPRVRPLVEKTKSGFPDPKPTDFSGVSRDGGAPGFALAMGQGGCPSTPRTGGCCPEAAGAGLKVAPIAARGFPHARGEMSSPRPRVSPQERVPKEPRCGCSCQAGGDSSATTSVCNGVCLGEA